MFILELTLRSWSHSEENKRRTLQRNDIAAAITRTDVFDFLVRLLCMSAHLRRDAQHDIAKSTTKAFQGLCSVWFAEVALGRQHSILVRDTGFWRGLSSHVQVDIVPKDERADDGQWPPSAAAAPAAPASAAAPAPGMGEGCTARR